MTRLRQRQIFICSLISLLVYSLSWYGLSFTIAKQIQEEPFRFTLSEKMPTHDEESYPPASLLWHVNQSNIAFIQNVTVISLNRVPIKSSGNVHSATHNCHQDTNSSHATISFRIIDSPNTVFKFIDGQTYQHLDIPPPHALASL